LLSLQFIVGFNDMKSNISYHIHELTMYYKLFIICVVTKIIIFLIDNSIRVIASIPKKKSDLLQHKESSRW
jgi:hypothetical protein